MAERFGGTSTDEIMLGPGEAVFYKITGASLLGERPGQRHWQGGSAGVSIPIGSVGGRAVRYRVGATRGHYVQGAPTVGALDTGTVFVTNRRVIFLGGRQTRECPFGRLLGFHHDDAAGSTTFSLSGSAKPVTVHYGARLSAAFDFRLDLALAHFRGTVADLVSQLKQDLARIGADRPAAPAGYHG